MRVTRGHLQLERLLYFAAVQRCRDLALILRVLSR